MAPAAFAQAAVAELGVGRADDRDGFEIVDRVKAEIEHVHADVVERAAAGDFLVAEPGAQLGDAGTAAPDRLRVVDIAEDAVLNEFLDLLRIGAEALVHAHKEDAAQISSPG